MARINTLIDEHGGILAASLPPEELDELSPRSTIVASEGQRVVTVDAPAAVLRRLDPNLLKSYHVELRGASGVLVKGAPAQHAAAPETTVPVRRGNGPRTRAPLTIEHGAERFAALQYRTNDKSMFACLRRNEQAVVARLMSADEDAAYVAGRWYELRRMIACEAALEILPQMIEDVGTVPELADVALDELRAHLEGVLRAETATARGYRLEDRIEAFADLADQVLADEDGGGRIKKALGIGAAGVRGQFHPFHSDDEIQKIYETPRTKTRAVRDVFDRDHTANDAGKYWALWSTVEWPHFVNDPEMLYCKEMTARFLGDDPTLRELPGGYVQRDGDIKIDGAYVGTWWDNRVYDYVPRIEQIHFPKQYAEEVFIYTCALENPGVFKVDWEKVRKQLEEKLDKYLDGLGSRVTDMLKGASFQGLSLAPLAGGVGAAKDLIKTIVAEIIDVLSNELKGSRYPPIVVTHRTIWVRQEPWSTVTYAYSAPNGDKTPIPGPPDEPAGADAVQWNGESKRPPKPARNLMTVGGAPLYWPPSDGNGGHVFIPMRYERGHYVVALRTEVRLIDVEFAATK